jgi:hypothetical protein
MVVVAVAAFAIGFGRLWETRQFYLRKAARHEESRAEIWFRNFPGFDPSSVPESAKYHEAMSRKYEHAARYPWLPVAPDPPEPK